MAGEQCDDGSNDGGSTFDGTDAGPVTGVCLVTGQIADVFADRSVPHCPSPAMQELFTKLLPDAF